MEALFARLDLDWRDMAPGEVVDVSDRGVQLAGPGGEWRDVKGAVRKQDAEAWALDVGGDTLTCSGQHRVLVKEDGEERPVFREVQHLSGAERVLHRGEYKPARARRTGETTPILDVFLSGDHTYDADGVASHNTMYGDKFVTPGGKAVPFHSSVRVELRKSKSITETVSGTRRQIGAVIRPKVAKNRLGPPGRKCEFDLFFSSGIDDAGSLYNALKDNKTIKHKGGGWYRLKAAEDADHEWFREEGSDEDFIFQKNDADSDRAFFRVINSHEEFRRACYDRIYDVEVISYDADWTGGRPEIEYVEAEDADPREVGD